MTIFRVAVSGDFFGPAGETRFPDLDLSPLEAAGVELCPVAMDDEIETDAIAGFDALILLRPKVTRQSLARADRLALIARFGVGYDRVDVDACTERAVALTITPDGVRRPVAVAELTLILALTSKLMIKDRLTRNGPEGWAERTHSNGVGLVGRTLGSIGIGNIGSELFKLAAPLGMRFMAYDPYADRGVADGLKVALVELETLLREADVLTINCPLTPETKLLLNEDRLRLMKPSAFLVNTARGGIVDQAALAAALREKSLAGAGLDVFEEEPLDQNDSLTALDNVILSPHALAWTDQLFAGIGRDVVAAIAALHRGETPAGMVNRTILKDPRWLVKLAACGSSARAG